jgi:hypothetical protein
MEALMNATKEKALAVEADKEVKVLVFESAVEGFFLNHSDFLANLKDLTSLPQGPIGCSQQAPSQTAFRSPCQSF